MICYFRYGNLSVCHDTFNSKIHFKFSRHVTSRFVNPCSLDSASGAELLWPQYIIFVVSLTPTCPVVRDDRFVSNIKQSEHEDLGIAPCNFSGHHLCIFLFTPHLHVYNVNSLIDPSTSHHLRLEK